MLSALPPPDDPRVLVGTSHADDAGVFRLSAEEALIGTLDFFTPIVDDPYVYGSIAAANSLSDVYAMGGEPLFALAIAAFPEDGKILPYLADVMAGAADKAKEAGVCIIGGHTIKDKEPKFGLSVTGRVHPDRMWHNRGAKPGDAIVLTKPLGTGIATSAIKWGICPKETEEAVIASMCRLNANASKAGRGGRHLHGHRRHRVRVDRAPAGGAGGERADRRDPPCGRPGLRRGAGPDAEGSGSTH